MDPATRALTFALTRDDAARPVLLALRGNPDPAAVEAVVELLCRPHTATARLAVETLSGWTHPLVSPTLIDALDSPLSSVRREAVEALARRGECPVPELTRRLVEDPSWLVRRAALARAGGRRLVAHPRRRRRSALARAQCARATPRVGRTRQAA